MVNIQWAYDSLSVSKLINPACDEDKYLPR